MKKSILILVSTLFVAVLISAPSCSRNPADPQFVKFNVDADNLITGLQQYKQFIGSYPAGDNVEISKALLGQTEKKVLILAVRKTAMNNKGEIVDPWGTPLQFYFSKNGVLIRSAGPDKIFEDAADPRCDDLFRTEMPAK
jgi:hypothetical protein